MPHTKPHLHHPHPWLALLPAVALIHVEAATTSLPASAAQPPGSGSERGFILRVVQAPTDATVANNYVRAIQQLNGTLRDAGGALIPNEALAGTNPDDSYNVDVINFELAGEPFDILDGDGNFLYGAIPELFPGIPGSGGHTEKFAVEVVGFLDLPAGPTTFGVNVGADRTDVIDDDSYQVYVGANPRDFFNPKVGEFQRSPLTPPFVSNSHNENVWTVDAPQAGIYPFRLVYWQTGRGANLLWYTMITATDERVLVNDSFDSRAIKAYRKSSVAAANSPYVAEVSPLPGSAGNSASAPIGAVLFDGGAALADATVKLSLNGAPVTPQTAGRTGNRYSLEYAPNASRPDPNNLVRLEFADANAATYTNEWQFTINVSGSGAAPVAGQWDFEAGNLAATVGTPLEFLGGAAGLTAQKTEFGTTTTFSIADIGGQPANVMRVPGDVVREIGYVMAHGISPNGGGTLVNQYTLIMDVFVVDSGPGAASLLQVSSPANTDDGDLFWQGNNFGQGTDGYRGKGTFTAGAWHRMAAAYDMAANPPVVVKYVDGIKQDDWTANQGLDNPRRAMQATAILFGDGDQDERREMFVNSIQIRAGRLSDAQLALLGGPSAPGIPQALPVSNVAGQWDFDFADLTPTVGAPLGYLDGPDGVTTNGTFFGITGEGDFAVVPLIDGQPAKVMRVPGETDRNIGYIMPHRIAPNGGGTLVNQYTLIMDVLVAETGPGAASLLQVSSPANTDDGDLFWQGNNFGQGTDGYLGRGTFIAGTWHR
ncbi:MAG: hypothetical protein ACYC23_23855, partial [Limisphaerales bacterium]